MTLEDTRPGRRSSEDAGARPQQGADRGRERTAQAHERSADIFERHAVLLDRFGAHRSAKTERRHAEDQRDAAATARRGLIPRPARGPREVSGRG
jgi:hypothetical protein